MANVNDKQDPDGPEEHANAITRASVRYAEAFPLRSLIQGIPYVGGSLDTILAGLGSRWQYERLSAFLRLLHRRLKAVGKRYAHTTNVTGGLAVPACP